MIQRIQTLYLLGALALLLICGFVPIADLTGNGSQLISVSLIVLIRMKEPISLGFLLSFLLGFIAFTNFICIFLYKRRKIQMKQCLISIVMLVVLNLLVLYELLYIKRSGMTVTFYIPFIFPLLAAVFTWLAYIRIKKDETLVKSYDRLR